MDTPIPISEAVEHAIAHEGAVYCVISIYSRSQSDPARFTGPLEVRIDAPDNQGKQSARVRDMDSDDPFTWEDATLVGAASALRLITRQLAPDVTAKALEIAVRHQARYGCPPPFAEDSGKPCGIPLYADSGTLPEQRECQACWHAWLLQQAHTWTGGQ